MGLLSLSGPRSVAPAKLAPPEAPPFAYTRFRLRYHIYGMRTSLRRWLKEPSGIASHPDVAASRRLAAPCLPRLESPYQSTALLDMSDLGYPLHQDNQAPYAPSLPLELERHIFELAARDNTKLAIQLLLVSHRVRVWVEPVIYSHLLLDQPDPLPFVRKLLRYKTPRFLAQHVTSICLTSIDVVETYRLLSTCSGVTNFGCWSRDSDSLHMTSIGPLISSFRLQRLSLSLNTVFGTPDFRQPFFSTITHLHVLDLPPHWNKWKGFDRLPSLTHLAFSRWSYHPDSIAALHRILSQCKRLQHLILVVVGSWFKSPVTFDKKIIDDPRVSFVPVYLPLKDWEDCANGGSNNMWSQAEKLASRKQIGKLLTVGHNSIPRF